MRLIADIFMRAEVTGESHLPVERAEASRPAHGAGWRVGALLAALRGAAGRWLSPAAGESGDVLCLHFTGVGCDHSAWLADRSAGARETADGTAVSWECGGRGVLVGRVSVRGAVVADVLAVGAPGVDGGSRSLRALGLSRGQAAVVAQRLGRPTLATFSRGPEMSPETQRRIHAVLLASLSRWARLRCDEHRPAA